MVGLGRSAPFLLLALAAACTGELGGEKGNGEQAALPAETEIEESPPHHQTFAVPRDEAQLLPFWARLEKLARIIGVDRDHLLLQTLRDNRLELGDHDYAQGVPENRIWSGTAMNVWVKSLIPLCASDEFRTKYPTFPTMDGTSIGPGVGNKGNDGRMPAKHVWRTVMKALKISDAQCDAFPDVAGAAPLSFMLRG
jgi:hypothetical protein